MEQLWDPWGVARALGVRVYWRLLAWPYRGRYGFVPGRQPRIVLHRDMDDVEARCVLAEELGHHVMCSHLYPVGAARDAAGRRRYDLAEAKAMRWAVDHLMPADQVAAQLAAGARPQDLMHAWRVTWKFLDYRLQTLPQLDLVVALRSA